MYSKEELISLGFVELTCIEQCIANDGSSLYWINRNGDVYSMRAKRVLNKLYHTLGYHQTYLTYFKGGGRFYKTHRLVAMQFLPNENEYTDVNHRNGIKTDNSVCNLEWCTHSENILHSYRELGRKHSSVHLSKKIRCSNGKNYDSAILASKDTGCATSNISACCNGKLKQTKKLMFEFV